MDAKKVRNRLILGAALAGLAGSVTLSSDKAFAGEKTDKTAKDSEHKCGEGKCGDSKEKSAKDGEEKCGEGKCGEGGCPSKDK